MWHLVALEEYEMVALEEYEMRKLKFIGPSTQFALHTLSKCPHVLQAAFSLAAWGFWGCIQSHMRHRQRLKRSEGWAISKE
jgi:hypothetical protein